LFELPAVKKVLVLHFLFYFLREAAIMFVDHVVCKSERCDIGAVRGLAPRAMSLGPN
jgi:hypothetical protein